jgi:hypothetical protein
MLLAFRTKRRLRLAIVACLVYALLIAIIAFIFPHEGLTFTSSFLRWCAAIPVAICIYAAMELFGTWSLDRPFWNGMSSWGRILLFVLLVVLAVVAIAFASHYLGGNAV